MLDWLRKIMPSKKTGVSSGEPDSPWPRPESNSNPKEYNLSSNSFTYGLLKDIFDGEKFPGGLNDKLDFFYIDYWTLRRRSYRLFTENRYASGLIRRLLTNEIHRGLTLEATPNGGVLGLDDDFINDWTEDVESKFDIWSENKEIVSYNHQSTFGELQIDARKTALLSGDVLVILRQHPILKTPTIELIDGSYVRTPIKNDTKNRIKHGVELDSKNRQVAYHVQDASDPTGLKSIRIPAKGPKSGRRIAWLHYGHKIRIDDVRGMPALGILLQALKELDRYSDAEQRAAVLNAIIPLFVKKGEERIGTRPIAGGAQRRDTYDVMDSDTGDRSFNIDKQIPGLILEELQYGEEPVSFSTMRPNVNYQVFEEAMMASFAWVNEIPPNIYRLAYSSNYSASGAEINEAKMYLDKIRYLEGLGFDKPIYKEWLVSMTLAGFINANGLLESWRDISKFLTFGAWTSSEWSGAIKPSLKKNLDIRGYTEAIKEGFVTRDIASKELYGKKYTTMVKRLNKENEQLVISLQPLIDAGLIKDHNISMNSGTKEADETVERNE